MHYKITVACCDENLYDERHRGLGSTCVSVNQLPWSPVTLLSG